MPTQITQLQSKDQELKVCLDVGVVATVFYIYLELSKRGKRNYKLHLNKTLTPITITYKIFFYEFQFYLLQNLNSFSITEIIISVSIFCQRKIDRPFCNNIMIPLVTSSMPQFCISFDIFFSIPANNFWNKMLNQSFDFGRTSYT